MVESLRRHGVKASAESLPSHGRNPAEAIMAQARETGAGLVVMGAYGHSRIREFVLGGATRHALSAMTLSARRQLPCVIASRIVCTLCRIMSI